MVSIFGRGSKAVLLENTFIAITNYNISSALWATMLSQPKSEQKREQLSKSKRCFIIFAGTFLFLFVTVLVQIFYKTPWNWMNSRKLEIWGNEILLDIICLSMGDLLKSISSKSVLKNNSTSPRSICFCLNLYMTVFALAVMEYAVGVSKFGKNPMTLLVHQY